MEGTKMRNALLLVVTLSLIAIAGRAPAHAQVIYALDADIPFSFTVRNMTLPAGDYTIRRVNMADPNLMEIQSGDGHSSLLFIVNDVVTGKAPNRPELIFDRVGDRYFLSEIFEVGSSRGVELRKSRAERNLEKEGKEIQTHSVTVSGALNAAK
jgi:hypothetical protein